MASYNNNKEAPSVNTSYPGHIYNFDTASQTCDVQIAIQSLFVGYSEAYSVKKKDMLQKVPVQFTQGGGWSLTHDVPDGTPCYVHFPMRGIDHWLFENKDEAPMNNGLPSPAFGRLYSHNDAVCTIGTQPIPKAIKSFLSGGMELRNADRSQRVTMLNGGAIQIITGAAKIVITKDSKIEIEVSSEASIKAPKITLDGDTTITKSLTVQGGMSVSGGSGASMTVTGSTSYTGNMTMNGDFTLNGIKVNTHKHTNPEGGDVGPMKA